MKNDLTIYIPIFSPSVAGKEFSSAGQNPGVGGTQFTSIKLGLLLADTYANLDIRYANDSEIALDRPRRNVNTIIDSDIDSFFDSLDAETGSFVVLSTMSLLRRAKYETVFRNKDRIVAWIRHPFQFDKRIAKMGLRAHVCVGSYQYYSNVRFYRPVWHIQNPFVAVTAERAPTKESAFRKSKTMRIVYLGALMRAKGFVHIARAWSDIKRLIPNVQLHVIGASSTYGRPPEHDLIPCDNELAHEILENIPQTDIEAGKVVFHGNLGREKFDIMRDCDAAILNPTGVYEAFPASPLECMAAGLPVIASDDYGMADSMSFFPELVLKTPDQIPSRLQWLISDDLRYEELRQRAFAVADWFNSQTGVILARWRRLFALLTGDQASIPNSGPGVPVHGSKLILTKRVARARLSHVKKVVSGVLPGGNYQQ